MKSNSSDANHAGSKILMARPDRPTHLLCLLALLVSLLFGMACSDEVDGSSPDTDDDASFELQDQCILFGDTRCYDGTFSGMEQQNRWMSAEGDLFEYQRLMLQPTCVDADGVGRSGISTCGTEPSEVNLYSHCTSPEEAREGSEPCIWWVLGYPAEDRDDICSFTVVCAPESMLTELGWPEGQGFDFHQNCGFDLCDESTWPGW